MTWHSCFQRFLHADWTTPPSASLFPPFCKGLPAVIRVSHRLSLPNPYPALLCRICPGRA